MIDWLKSSSSLLKNVAGTIGVKGLSLIVSLFTTAAYMHYFPNQVILGVWLALVSMLNWIMNFDLGIGNGLRNKLVGALSSGDKKFAKQCISSAYVILGAVSLCILIVGNIGLGFINWNSLLNIPSDILAEGVLILIVRITFTGVILQFFLRLIISILYAVQKSAIANFITLVSNSLILLFVCLFKVENIEKGMIILSVMQAITVNIPLIIATIWVFNKSLNYARPNLKWHVSSLAKGILTLGYQFFWIQLSLLIINSTNDFLIARLFGPNYVVEYQVYDKVFILISSGFSLITVPIWSAVTKAAFEKKIKWIKKTYLILMLLALGICSVSLIIPLLFQNIVNIWLGDKSIIINIQSAYVFAIYNSILALNYASTSVANGLGKLKLQMWCNTIAAVLKIPLVYILAGVLDNWICVVLVNIIIMLPCAVLQPISLIKHLTKDYKEDNEQM